MYPEENAGEERTAHGVAAVPTEIKLQQIEEMFRMCGLRPLSQDIQKHLSGEELLSDEDVARIISAGERFAQASRSVGLKELDYLDEPAKYIEGAAANGGSGSQPGGGQGTQTVEIEVTEEDSEETSGDEGGEESSEAGETGDEQEGDSESGSQGSDEEDQ